MNDEKKTRADLIQELDDLRRQVQVLKDGEIRLRASEERYRNFVENVEDLCFETDLAGNFIFINERACLKLGYRCREDLLGMNNRLYSTPDSAPQIAVIFKELYRTGIPADYFDYEVLDAKRERRFMQLSVSLIRDKDGHPTGFRGIARDVTDLKKMAIQRERYSDFVENIEDGCFEMDMEGRFLYGNEAFLNIIGYRTLEEYMALPQPKRHPTREEAERVVRLYEEIYWTRSSGKIVEYQIVRGGDGEIRIIEVSLSIIRDKDGKPCGFRGIGRDITERRRMLEALESYRNFVENIEDGCFEVDLRGNMTFCNTAACHVFGYDREELLGMNNRVYTTEETAARCYRVFNDIYQDGISRTITDYEIIQKNGQVRYLEMAASLIRNATGRRPVSAASAGIGQNSGKYKRNRNGSETSLKISRTAVLKSTWPVASPFSMR